MLQVHRMRANRTPFRPSAWMLLVFVFAFYTVSANAVGQTLPGTKPLTLEGDLASHMVDGIDRFLLKQTDATTALREKNWTAKTTDQRRARLRKILGLVDERPTCRVLELVATTQASSLVGEGASFEIHEVRWPTHNGIHGEGLLLRSKRGDAKAAVVAIPDADQTPEQLVGLAPGIALKSQFARRLAEAGIDVLVPCLIDRADEFSTTRAGISTNQPHREFVYRPAFEMGRTLLGYEVDKILAGVEFFRSNKPEQKIGVIGYGEGGLLALLAGALAPQIDAVGVGGSFDNRNQLWREPIYRNLFGFLNDFGDAELAAMILPRRVFVEPSPFPKVAGPAKPRPGKSGAAPGVLSTPDFTIVKYEVDRARRLAGVVQHPGPWDVVFTSDKTTESFGGFASTCCVALGLDSPSDSIGSAPKPLRFLPDSKQRIRRQMEQMLEHTQALMRESEYTRRKLWASADRQSRDVAKFVASRSSLKEQFDKEVIGRFDLPLSDLNPRSRKIYDEPKFVGYEVTLDVFPEVFAYGILLLPKDIKQGEKRPVVVCQHGLEGRPTDVANPKLDHPAYHTYACKLAERGFVTFAPQNPYIFYDRFRTLQRKLNPLGKTLFSVIIPQHRQIVRYLAGLPMVDANRIAFYGLSYGGKSAMRIPALVDEYCLSICSADFNEWIWKNTSLRAPFSYVGTMEYEIFEFDLGNTFNYAEMAALIAPRPFMVERGHRDGVAPDEWVAYEYAKVRLLYTDLKIGDRTTIEFFDGPHTINGVGTFEFLAKHLNWPAPR